MSSIVRSEIQSNTLLPSDIWGNVCKYLPPQDMARLGLVDRFLYSIIHHDTALWNKHLSPWLGKPHSPEEMLLQTLCGGLGLSPAVVYGALATRSPQKLPPSAYLAPVLARTSPVPFRPTGPVNMAETTRMLCEALSSDNLICGEKTVGDYVQRVIERFGTLLYRMQHVDLKICVRTWQKKPQAAWAKIKPRALGDAPASWISTTALQGHTGVVWNVTVLPDGRPVTVSDDCTARVWTEQPDSIWRSVELRGHTNDVLSATVLSDGRLVTASSDHTARVWTEQPDSTWRGIVLQGHTEGVLSATVLPDGRLVTVSSDHTARVWTEQPNRTWRSIVLQGHTGSVENATALPDGRLVTVSGDRTARVWTEQPNRTWRSIVLQGHTGTVMSASVVPGGRLVTASHDRTARVWCA